MGRSVKITRSNATSIEEALNELRARLDELARLTESYPVECSFGGYRFVFSSREDIQGLIDVLDEKLRDYRAAA